MGKVRVERPARITEKRKLFHEKTKDRMAVATTPGLKRGRAMRQKTPRYEQPSMRAAASSSAGSISQEATITQSRIGWPTMRLMSASRQDQAAGRSTGDE